MKNVIETDSLITGGLVLKANENGAYSSIPMIYKNEGRPMFSEEILAFKSEIPTQISQLSEDSTHRVITDEERARWDKQKNLSLVFAIAL